MSCSKTIPHFKRSVVYEESVLQARCQGCTDANNSWCFSKLRQDSLQLDFKDNTLSSLSDFKCPSVIQIFCLVKFENAFVFAWHSLEHPQAFAQVQNDWNWSGTTLLKCKQVCFHTLVVLHSNKDQQIINCQI